MNVTNSLAGALLAAVLLLAGASAQAVVRGHTTDGRLFMCGGVGEEERALLHGDRHRYSFWLTTAAARTGAHLTDVHVRIVDRAKRVVFEHVMDGPWLFIDLPLGRYEIEATINSESRRSATTIHAGDHHQMVLYFDVQADVLPAAEQSSRPNPYDDTRR